MFTKKDTPSRSLIISKIKEVKKATLVLATLLDRVMTFESVVRRELKAVDAAAALFSAVERMAYNDFDMAVKHLDMAARLLREVQIETSQRTRAIREERKKQNEES